MTIEIYKPQYIHEVGALAEKQGNALWPIPGKETMEDRFFIVCDSKGDDAVSQEICKTLVTWFCENVAEGEPVNDKQLKRVLEQVCKDSSMALLYIHKDGVTAAHTGNCRIYHARAKKTFLSCFRKNYEILYQSKDLPIARFGKTDSVNSEVVHITEIQPNDVFAICNAGMLEMDEAGEETFISSIMSHKIGVMSPKESSLEYFKREIAKVLCHYNYSAWVLHVKDVIN